MTQSESRTRLDESQTRTSRRRAAAQCKAKNRRDDAQAARPAAKSNLLSLLDVESTAWLIQRCCRHWWAV